MSTSTLNPADTGLEVVDLASCPAFAARHIHIRDAALQAEGMQRLARAFVEKPETILHELVHAAVDLCGADSAGISMELEDTTEERYYEWVATAGEYTGFQYAQLPHSPSACSLCLDRDRPQLFRVSQKFFDLMGIQAAIVTDGLLLPWQVGQLRGTIWIMAHGRTEAFDGNDLRMMEVLADFVAMGIREQQQRKLLMQQTNAAAAAAMANDLAHSINNPLQSVTNLLYLAEQGENGNARSLALELSGHVQRLSALVAQLLSLPKTTAPLE